MNPTDDELRDALRAGADRAAPPRPPFDDVEQRARRATRRRRAVAGGGIAVVLLAGGALAWAAAEDPAPETDVVADEGDAPTTTRAMPTTTDPPPSSTSTTILLPTLAPPPVGERPDQLVAIDEHGRLVVIEAASGDEVRELDADGDPTVPVPPEAEMGPNILGDVALAPGGVVYYTSVGEPAGGSLLRVGLDGTPVGGADHGWAFGNHVAVRPDGLEVASVSTADISVYDTTTTPSDPPGRQVLDPALTEHGGLSALDWSLDGRLLAAEQRRYPVDDGSSLATNVVVGSAAGPGPARLLGAAVADRAYTSPAFRRDGMLVVADQDACPDPFSPPGCGNALARVLDPDTGAEVASFEYGTTSAVVDQSYDATGTWLLVTFGDGTLRWYGSGQTGTVPGRYRAADW